QLTILFFRRVSPVETRMYAFTRNSFAVVAMGILIFRTITALQKAQNEIRTRMASYSCDLASPVHYPLILLGRLVYDSRSNTSLPEDANITVSAAMNDPNRHHESYSTTTCFVIWSQPFQLNSSLNDGRDNRTQNRTLELFDCRSVWAPPRIQLSPLVSDTSNSDFFTYRVEVRPGGRTPGGEVVRSQLPHIWLVNREEFNALKWSNVNEVRAYLPPLKLLPGHRIVAEANLITRRFIKSPIVKDIIFNFQSDYRSLSLYPIVNPSVVTPDASDANLTLATIHLALAPGLMYLRNQANVQDPNVSPSNICDFVEDYRSSTILDVISSVGGLFALLQAAHLLLFGRPLFWGLAGQCAKLITPFGLLGACSSRGFRRRLKGEYHNESETIQIVKFLRDFVIDFGPADLDPEQQRQGGSAPSSRAPVNNDGDSLGTRIMAKKPIDAVIL
ncbi:unnamed protein product, partial [Rhizoctonia solani]